MTQHRFVKSEIEGRIGIETEYNANFVKALKAKVPSCNWNGQEKIWFFDEIAKPDVENLVKTYWPPESEIKNIRIEWNLSRDNPTIDGIGLASISRDYWNWRRNCPVKFRVIEEELKSGGSRNNPGLFGKLIIEAKIRPEAEISPEPESTTEVAEPEIATEPERTLEIVIEDLWTDFSKKHGEARALDIIESLLSGRIEITEQDQIVMPSKLSRQPRQN